MSIDKFSREKVQRVALAHATLDEIDQARKNATTRFVELIKHLPEHERQSLIEAAEAIAFTQHLWQARYKAENEEPIRISRKARRPEGEV